MKNIYRLQIVLLLCLLEGCVVQNPKSELPVLDVEKAVPGKDLKISDILDHVRIIKLETRSDVLLPGSFQTWIGDRYIVTLGRDEIHLFTADGKYVRKIARQGRGPEEYLNILGYCVDSQEEHLYLADGDNCICVIDFNTGKMLQKIPTQGGTPYKLLFSGQDTLTYIPMASIDEKEDNDICQVMTDGTFIGGIRGVRKGDLGGIPYLGKINDTIRYKLCACDTLFMLQDTLKIPYCRIITDQPYSVATGKGKTVEVVFENKDLFLLVCVKSEVKSEGEETFCITEFSGHFVFAKSDFKLKKIKGFYVDILDYTDTEFFPLIVAGKRAYWNINVSKFKELLKDKLDSPLIADTLKTLYNELTEDDNPLLLVGDIKE